jgi:hypothetical protein
MNLASYKSNRPGLRGLFNMAVRWWLGGKYSHTEIIFSDGMCGSSSWLDGGVRLKRIDIKADHWDITPINGDEKSARHWFEIHQGQGFDLLGLLGFVWRRNTEHRGRWFCSEACAAALGFSEPHRFDPCSLPVALRHQTDV